MRPQRREKYKYFCVFVIANNQFGGYILAHINIRFDWNALQREQRVCSEWLGHHTTEALHLPHDRILFYAAF